MEFTYIIKEDKIIQIRPEEVLGEDVEMDFEDIIYLGLSIDKLTKTPFLLNVTSNEHDFVIESDDSSYLLALYQEISPKLLERDFVEKQEDIDDDFAVIATVEED